MIHELRHHHTATFWLIRNRLDCFLELSKRLTVTVPTNKRHRKQQSCHGIATSVTPSDILTVTHDKPFPITDRIDCPAHVKYTVIGTTLQLSLIAKMASPTDANFYMLEYILKKYLALAYFDTIVIDTMERDYPELLFMAHVKKPALHVLCCLL